jgi:hypothetical protein
MNMILDFVFVLPVIYGLYLFVKTPLNLKYGLPTWSDPALGFTLSIITAMYFYFVHFSLTELSIADPIRLHVGDFQSRWNVIIYLRARA